MTAVYLGLYAVTVTYLLLGERRRARIGRSPMAAHVRAATRAAFVPGCACVGLILALTYLQALTPVTGGIR